jgi:isoquinoline 1-oxidoreductase alpha subunit
LRFREKEIVVMPSIVVNGKALETSGDETMPLLWFLRDELNLTGTKYGCGAGVCGACTVHVDGVAVRSCLTTVGEAAGKTVTTIEGLSEDGEHPVQKAWRELSVPQCGFCQAGQIMQAAALLNQNRAPNDDQIVEEMSGNLCRCGCYQRIHEAIRLAAGGV